MTEPSTVGATKHTRDFSSGTDRLVGSWLDSLAAGAGGPRHTTDVVEAYRSMATSLVDGCLLCDDVGEAPFSDDQLEELDRLLARVAAANRKAGLTISATLDDVGRLGRAMVEWVGERDDVTEGEVELLALSLRFMRALDEVTRRLVRILEDSSARAGKEHARALGAMTEMLSHELRNRLGAAKTASQMLLSSKIGLDAQGVARAANLVSSSVDAALRTVEDVRAVAADGLHLASPPRRSLPLPTLIRSVVDELRPEASAMGVMLETRGELPDCRVDAARVRLIVFNLLGNGIKYSRPEASPPKVTVHCCLEDDSVELSVIDNGIGIPEDEIEDIFLYRVRGSVVGSADGSGLGLAIVAEAVEQIDGTLVVDSTPGEGTTFTVTFPSLDEDC